MTNKIQELLDAAEPDAWLGSIVEESGYGIYYERKRHPVARLYKNSSTDSPLYSRATVEKLMRQVLLEAAEYLETCREPRVCSHPARVEHDPVDKRIAKCAGVIRSMAEGEE